MAIKSFKAHPFEGWEIWLCTSQKELRKLARKKAGLTKEEAKGLKLSNAGTTFHYRNVLVMGSYSNNPGSFAHEALHVTCFLYEWAEEPITNLAESPNYLIQSLVNEMVWLYRKEKKRGKKLQRKS